MEEAGQELQGNDGVEVIITLHGIHANIDTWVMHHPQVHDRLCLTSLWHLKPPVEQKLWRLF